MQTMFVWIGISIVIILSWLLFLRPQNKKSIASDIVLVTGAGGDIGRLLALNFAKLGATLVLWDISKEWNDETARQIGQIGGKAHSYVCDVTKKEEVYRTAEQVTKDVGHVTILVNNAGVMAGKKLLELPDYLIERTMNVNTMAIFWTIKAFLPAMIANNSGHLVTMASMAGVSGCPDLSDYCASKHAAVGLHESLALELAAQGLTGIHTTLVQPNWINTGLSKGVKTGQIPAMEPEYVVGHIVNAVLRNQRLLRIPSLMYAAPVVKSLVPVDAWLRLAESSGSFKSMDTFIGRQ
ncbi:epidermal retinol dehydrogenase 2-like [Glandiceps talaboti]